MAEILSPLCRGNIKIVCTRNDSAMKQAVRLVIIHVMTTWWWEPQFAVCIKIRIVLNGININGDIDCERPDTGSVGIESLCKIVGGAATMTVPIYRDMSYSTILDGTNNFIVYRTSPIVSYNIFVVVMGIISLFMEVFCNGEH